MKYHFKIHQEETGYWGECLELEGCVSQGQDMKELEKNLKDSLNAYLFDPDNEIVFPFSDPGISKEKDILLIEAEPSIAFSNYLRFLRKNHHLTQEETAKKMGYKATFGYQRLESGKNTVNLTTLVKLKKVFPELSLDFILK